MVEIKDKEGNTVFHVSDKLHGFLMRCREKIHKDDTQVLGFFWGKVGCGKSLKAQHLGYVIDPTLSISRVCFNKEEFINAVLDAEKKVIIADEGISLFNKRAVMTRESREVAELMDQIRQKNLCVFICIPNILSIDKDILEQADFGAFIWESRDKIKDMKVTVKGNMELYPNTDEIKFFDDVVKYLKKRKEGRKHNFKPSPALTEKGTRLFKKTKPFYPVGERGYRKKKGSILEKYRQPVEKTRVDLLRDIKKKHPEITDKMLGKVFGISREWTNTLRNKGVRSDRNK